MEHARQWFVDLSRFMMGGSEAVCERGEESWGEAMGGTRASFFFSVQDSERLEISGRW